MKTELFQKFPVYRGNPLTKTLLVMKLAVFLIFLGCLHASAGVYSQTVSLSENGTPLNMIFKKIEKQTDFSFVYNNAWMAQAIPVTINVKEVSIRDALDICFKDQPFSYTIIEHIIVLKERPSPITSTNSALFGDLIDLEGHVTDSAGNPLIGASVLIKGDKIGSKTDQKGSFILKNIPGNAVLLVSFTGYQFKEVRLTKGMNVVNVVLEISNSSLDQVQVIAYGTSTKRLNTGNVITVQSDVINNQPVSNPLAALEGRVPGMIVTQSTGVPGASFQVQIRGRSSISQNSDPLFIIDGVPFAANNTPINQLFSAVSVAGIGTTTGISPFNSINPNDIESIDVLKDADATSIYGSRGGNGVVLITTKKGKKGKTKFDFNIYNGISKVARTMDLLNTKQYLAMRREAFANDNATPTHSNAYDLLDWDTTRYTDFKKLLIGGTAHATNAQASLSGGNNNTQFLIGLGYNGQTTVFPGDFSDNRESIHMNINHSSNDNRFALTLSNSFSYDKNNLISADLSNFINAVPDLPKLFDSSGNLVWSSKGHNFTNPLSYLKRTNLTDVSNLITNLLMSYKILSSLSIRSTFGYNSLDVNESGIVPIAAQNPAFSPTGSLNLANSNMKGWIIEPQIEYNHKLLGGKINVLMGGTLQQNQYRSTSIDGEGFTNDALIKTMAGATSTTAINNASEYKYDAFFGRVNYNFHDKYIVNLSGRRDGSSRFGPGRQFADFGAVGINWIFSNEKFMQAHFPFLSFGKLRGTYGTSGNDKIGDYQFLETWSVTPYSQGGNGYNPTSLFNPDYSWEIKKGIELGVTLGFLNDRMIFSGTFYRNRSSNQLINYQLPSQTGFSSVLQNFGAVVQNSGFELEISIENIKTKNLKWNSSFTLSVPRNKLVEFPNISNSSYSGYVVGKSLNNIAGFKFDGVDPSSGLYLFTGKDGKPTTTPEDVTDYNNYLGTYDPKFYGGLSNSLNFKNWQIDVFIEFRKQIGQSYLYNLTNRIPGTRINQPEIVLNRWQKPGDNTDIAKYTTTVGSPAYTSVNLLAEYGSDKTYTDASFARLKNLSISYNFKKLLRKIHTDNVKVYIQGQNLFTITKYLGTDPENQNFLAIPPLKTFTVGLQVTF